MSEVFHLPGAECGRARSWMAALADGDLAAEQSTWLRGHLESCADCRAMFARFTELDREFTGWGEQLGRDNPPPAGGREQLSARLDSHRVRRRASRWISAAAAVAAVVAAAVIGPFRAPPAGNRVVKQEEARFVEIPYVAPLDPRENTTIVRMNIRVATLIAAGYRVTADPDTMVPADVLVGEDGRAHAVRVLSDIDLNGTGD